MKRFDEKILKDILFWAKDQYKGNKWNAAFQNIGKMWKFDQLGPKYMGPTGFVRYLTELPHIHLSEADRDRVFNFNLELNRKDSSLFEQISEGSPDNFYIDHSLKIGFTIKLYLATSREVIFIGWPTCLLP